jgi:hypothetical protein
MLPQRLPLDAELAAPATRSLVWPELRICGDKEVPVAVACYCWIWLGEHIKFDMLSGPLAVEIAQRSRGPTNEGGP